MKKQRLKVFLDIGAGQTPVCVIRKIGADKLKSGKARTIAANEMHIIVDTDEDVLHISKGLMERFGIRNALFMKGRAEQLPRQIKRVSVDHIDMRDLLSLRGKKRIEIDEAVREIARVLKRDGTVTISGPIEDAQIAKMEFAKYNILFEKEEKELTTRWENVWRQEWLEGKYKIWTFRKK